MNDIFNEGGKHLKQSLLLTSEAMFEAVLHDNKELLERWVVRVQCSSKAQSRLDQPFNTQLGHVQQVGSLHGHGVPQGCRTKAAHKHLTKNTLKIVAGYGHTIMSFYHTEMF